MIKITLYEEFWPKILTPYSFCLIKHNNTNLSVPAISRKCIYVDSHFRHATLPICVCLIKPSSVCPACIWPVYLYLWVECMCSLNRTQLTESVSSGVQLLALQLVSSVLFIIFLIINLLLLWKHRLLLRRADVHLAVVVVGLQVESWRSGHRRLGDGVVKLSSQNTSVGGEIRNSCRTQKMELNDEKTGMKSCALMLNDVLKHYKSKMHVWRQFIWFMQSQQYCIHYLMCFIYVICACLDMHEAFPCNVHLLCMKPFANVNNSFAW